MFLGSRVLGVRSTNEVADAMAKQVIDRVVMILYKFLGFWLDWYVFSGSYSVHTRYATYHLVSFFLFFLCSLCLSVILCCQLKESPRDCLEPDNLVGFWVSTIFVERSCTLIGSSWHVVAWNTGPICPTFYQLSWLGSGGTRKFSLWGPLSLPLPFPPSLLRPSGSASRILPSQFPSILSGNDKLVHVLVVFRWTNCLRLIVWPSILWNKSITQCTDHLWRWTKNWTRCLCVILHTLFCLKI